MGSEWLKAGNQLRFPLPEACAAVGTRQYGDWTPRPAGKPAGDHLAMANS